MKFTKEKIGMRDELFNSFANDIRCYQPLDEQKEREIIRRIKNGDQSAVDELVKANQRFIIKVAKDYARADNLMDLIDEGNLGMMIALSEYDPDKTTEDGKPIRFLSFAVWYIRREIVSYIIRECPTVVKSNSAKTFGKVNKINDEFFQKEHRYPTVDELQEILLDKGVDIKNANDLYDVSYSSIDNTLNDEDEEATFEGSRYFNEKTASENNYNGQVEQDYNAAIVNAALAYFNEREQKIIKMLYGIGYEKAYTVMEVASEMNICNERVRQIKLDCEKKLKRIIKKVMKSAI